ncbi:hypothetical protein [Xylanibacter ruminicola]|uniref:hypothetical protein n=1 Tax=Xylanibacter ruminicola TaxID=839 RepID=UPI00048B937D|nr:hypothetical protein [Xylanibacter ruminicola]
MKKNILFIILGLVPLFVYSQTSSGRWNNITATYTNETHQITWKLIEGLDWIGRPILSESTLFKVRNDDTHILVKLGANKAEGLKGDVWDLVSDQEHPQLEMMHRQQAQKNGMTYLGTKSAKSQICGYHAIKKRIDMKKNYPELGQTVHCIEIEYTLYAKNYIYIISVMALSVLEEETDLFETVAAQIFNGFSLN